ncbi:MAG: ATP-binding protein [Burkholderiaceae bacterium]|nr:ATP-binding protein [Burkholderiaceae bacterium]
MIIIEYNPGMYTRHILPLLNEALTDTPVVLLNGARQTGKSTLTQSLSGESSRRYLTLDDHVTLAAAKGDPDGFIAGLNGPVTLDEVQRVPELFLAIKASVDRDRRPGRFLLTGSANVLLLPDIADSLAGRMEILSLWPLSTAEMAGVPTVNLVDWLFDGPMNAWEISPCDRTQLIEKLLCGGYPEAVGRPSPRRRAAWFNSYLQAIMQRDVRDLANVEQLTEIPNLIQLLSTRSASLLNFAEISRSSGLPQTTLKRYFSLLETLFLVYRLPAWERNLGKRLVKAPKVFLPDSGLLAHLVELSPERLAIEAGLPGSLVETFVLSEILKHLAFSERQLTLWHYRTQSNIEVDFILENRLGKLTGIEVKASHSVGSKDFNGLRHLKETEPQFFQRGIVLYSGREVVPFGADLFAVPLSMWWAFNKRAA